MFRHVALITYANGLINDHKSTYKQTTDKTLSLSTFTFTPPQTKVLKTTTPPGLYPSYYQHRKAQPSPLPMMPTLLQPPRAPPCRVKTSPTAPWIYVVSNMQILWMVSTTPPATLPAPCHRSQKGDTTDPPRTQKKSTSKSQLVGGTSSALHFTFLASIHTAALVSHSSLSSSSLITLQLPSPVA